MSSPLIRPFRRSDREQVTELVNAHVGAVLPGVSVSVNAVMSQLEREPGEMVVDPWVVERTTLVVEEHERVVAAAHLLRYGDEERVGEWYRNLGEIRWLVCMPERDPAGTALMAAVVRQFEAWGVARQASGISLPAPACYGVPDCWPHLRALLVEAGFEHKGRIELVLVADVAALPSAGPPPIDGLVVRREMGGPMLATTLFGAWLGDDLTGFVSLCSDLTNGGALSRLAGWGDLDTLSVEPAFRRRGVATWLIGHAADWLRLGRCERVIAYATADQEDVVAFLAAMGWRLLVRVESGWVRAT